MSKVNEKEGQAKQSTSDGLYRTVLLKIASVGLVLAAIAASRRNERWEIPASQKLGWHVVMYQPAKA